MHGDAGCDPAQKYTWMVRLCVLLLGGFGTGCSDGDGDDRVDIDGEDPEDLFLLHLSLLNSFFLKDDWDIVAEIAVW
jgi:hypothetical protein